MKNFKTLFGKVATLSLVLVLVLAASCGKDDEVSIPDIRVSFSFAPTNPEAGQEVTFTNASNGGDTFAWDFGDGSNSTDKNPTHTYTESGSFAVSLEVDGFKELTASKDVVVGDPVPVITFAPDVVEAGSEITFSATVYNPNSETVTYAWAFGDNANVDDATAASPKVVFTAAGTVSVSLVATVGSLATTGTTDVSVVAQLAKTLIFSVVDMAAGSGSIWSKKLLTGFEEDSMDMNVPTNSHPLTLRVRNNRVYVFDPGNGITFTTDPAAVDGAIYSTALDGTDFITHISMAGGDGDYTRDPFFGDVTSTKIYWGDRRNGVYSIDESTANMTYTQEGVGGYFVGNNELGYYSAYRTDGGPTYGWGALNGSFLVRDNAGTEEFWWAKNSNHKGLWRFTAEDIAVVDVVPALGGVLTSEAVRAFELDETNQKIYFSINKDNTGNPMGLYRSDLDGSNLELIDDSAFDSEGGDSERTGITGIAVDAEGGYVYWGYRATATPDDAKPLEAKSGIKRWAINGTAGTDMAEFYIEDVWAYGIAIDHDKK